MTLQWHSPVWDTKESTQSRKKEAKKQYSPTNQPSPNSSLTDYLRRMVQPTVNDIFGKWVWVVYLSYMLNKNEQYNK